MLPRLAWTDGALPTYNFVINSSEAELEELLNITDLDDYMINNNNKAAALFLCGEMNWCLQSYINLGQRGTIPVTCSNTLDDNAINIIHSDYLLNSIGRSSAFTVCVRADYPSRRWAHYHLVQNKTQVTTQSTFIPHWPQPGLKPRDPIRKGVHRVAYQGQTSKNLAADTKTWQRMFEPYGIKFVILPPNLWHDLSNIDVLIGVRSFDTQPHNSKPPTKLFNAWHAHIPFIGGYDSAYRQVGCPDKDYLVVKSPQEAVDAVLRLRSDSDLYATLVQNGSRKAPLYTKQAISAIWEKALLEDVMRRYIVWKQSRSIEVVKFNTNLAIGLAYHYEKQLVKGLIRSVGNVGRAAGLMR